MFFFMYNFEVANFKIYECIPRGCYFQEGSEVKMEMRVESAYQKSLETVVEWIHRKVNTTKTQVFFRTYAPVHFRFHSSFSPTFTITCA